jgi:NodT family efflux transporter outer membrane factor (OMF) lipoprotein
MPTELPRRAIARRSSGFSASLLALLAGCTVGPDFTPPEPPKLDAYVAPGEAIPEAAPTRAGEVPADKQGIAMSEGGGAGDEQPEKQELLIGERVAGDWWGLLRSRRLDSVLREAVDGNHTLAAAKATLAQARATVNQVAGGLLPQVDLSARASRGKQNFATAGIDQQGPTSNLYSIGPQVSYNLDLAGGQKRQVEQQAAIAEFQDHQLSAAYLTLTGNAVQQAVTIAAIRAQIKVVQEIVVQDEKTVASVQEQVAVGEATKIDLQSAISQLATDRTQLPPLRQQLAAAKHALSVLTGKAPAQWTPPDFDLAEFTLPKNVPVSLPSALVRQRPDILAAEAQLHAATAQVGVATAQLYPNVNLTASIGTQVLNPSNLFAGSGLIWSVASGLTAPLFHGGALEAQTEAAKAGMQERYESYQQTVVASFGQVADVLASLQHDAELLSEQRKAVDSTEAGARMARESFGTGLTSLLQVLDAERQYDQARLGYVRTLGQRIIDTAQLYTAMGGGWWDWKDRTAAAAGAPPKA